MSGPLTSTVRHDRRFYAANRAFGRFGMRIFAPVTMDGPHWHGHIEGNLSTTSDLVYQFDGEKIRVPAGQPVFFWAGIPHQLAAIEAADDRDGPVPELCNLYLPLDSFLIMPHIARLQVALLSGGIVAAPADLCNRQHVERWYRDYRSHDVERSEIVKMELNALFRRLSIQPFTFVRQPWENGDAEGDLASTHVRHVVAMIRFVLENLGENMTSADVTRSTGLHANYAQALFTRTMRLPLKKFIIRMRLLRARAMLLESNVAITTIATQCGFNSMTQFYRHFTMAYGTPPNRLRQSYRNSDTLSGINEQEWRA
ncbi:MAG: helix-turn-helix domain-containing protein [Geminicoccaceae bacterium]